jgi:hypothetical protein
VRRSRALAAASVLCAVLGAGSNQIDTLEELVDGIEGIVSAG